LISPAHRDNFAAGIGIGIGQWQAIFWRSFNYSLGLVKRC
jgi:hypothetical protein